MRTWMAITAGLLMAACGAYTFPGSPSPAPSTGTVSGRVVAIPCAPVEPVGNRCAGRPVPGLQIVFHNASTSVSTTTDANGDFSIQLTSGAWNVRLATYMRVISGPTSVTVAPNTTSTADFLLDSGIRARG